MRLVAVSVVKNEADIIEAFVRHTLAWVDHHLVFDHDSTDGTREILVALQAEGLPVSLFRDDAPGHLQQVRSNYLTRLAATRHGADWVLPFDADEILCGPDRATLEQSLQQRGASHPASLPLLEYHPTDADDPSVANPILRLRHCQPAPSTTRKIFVPRPLALDAALIAGKGSHALHRGTEALVDQPLPDGFFLAHLALRSLEHQVLRVVRAELQRLSRVQAGAGLDVHYRLGFQRLAEDPEHFFATVRSDPATSRLRPIDYRGAPLRHTRPAGGWARVARALLPYLEQLAISHGRLADATGFDIAAPTATESVIRELEPTDLPPSLQAEPTPAFAGFTPKQGWGRPEGPIPEAFLPAFHWGHAPVTELIIPADLPHPARLVAEALTYSENQTVRIELNGVPVLQHAFGRVNQKESLTAPLTLRAGNNLLALHYSQGLVTPHDPRKLAVIFLALRVLPPA